MDLRQYPDFSLLPSHIITQSLQYLKLDDLKNASLVCKSWHYASTDPQIARTLILEPKEDIFPEICKSNRKYGILRLQFLEFDKSDDYYFELFEKFAPFVHELHVIDSDLKIHHLLKLFELTTCLNIFSFSECSQLVQLPGLFPVDYDYVIKSRIIQNLSGINQIVIEHFVNIPFIADLIQCTTSLNSLEFSNEFLEFDGPDGNSYQKFLTIFDNDNSAKLRHLNLHLNFSGSADEFIMNFVKIKYLNLISFRIVIWWIWKDGIYKSLLFRQFILKLQSLEEFSIYGLRHDQLSIICQHLVNLKSLDCLLFDDQAISELANLKQLEIITQILGYFEVNDLKIASSVCKSFYEASTHSEIAKSLIIVPTEDNIPDICKSNRKYGILKLQFLEFDKPDNYYFEFFEKFAPFIHELHIIESDIKIHHLLKLLELTTYLKIISLCECSQLTELSGFFPVDYDVEATTKIVENLSGVNKIVIEQFINIPFIVDLVRCTTNLNTFEFDNDSVEYKVDDGKPYQKFFTIFDNDNVSNIKHLTLQLYFVGCAEEFITSFIKINNLNLKTFNVVIWWIWEDKVYKSSLFRQFILKLQNLVKFSIYGFCIEDQLSIICQHLTNLKSLDCLLCGDQPISEITNLKQLEVIYCRFRQECSRMVNFREIDKFFNYKFEYLQKLYFEEFVDEGNLTKLCENHPNLIELNLTRLLTGNLEIIFKYLTKLRVLSISFGSVIHTTRKLHREYEYKISRLKDLEEFQLEELVNGIREEDVKQLKKLRSTNLPVLFRTRNFRL